MLLILALFPIAQCDTLALDNTQANAVTRMTVKAVETVGIRLASNIQLDLVPTSAGSFGILDTELGVTTNDPEGFEVFLSSTDREAALRGAQGQINSIQQDTVGAAFTGNTWGYTIGKEQATTTSTYSAIPATSSSILKTKTATVDTEEVYRLGFGVNITPSLPAGEYSSSVLLSVVANPAIISNLSDLVYMQDMSPNICNNTYPTATDLLSMTEAEKTEAAMHPVTKQLYDIRDGKQYWVAKLADGNCWMTQNLALDLDANSDGNAVAITENGSQVELSPRNTDIEAVWKGVTKTETEIPARTGALDYSSARSWNLGKLAWSNPSSKESCSQPLPEDLKELGYEASQWGVIYYGSDLAEICPLVKDVRGYAPTLIASEASAVDTTKEIYDAHYLIGNAYAWNTATAGAGDDVTKNLENATTSICPANWRLPTTGINKANAAEWPTSLNDDFYGLFYSYGYPSLQDNATASEWVNFDWGGLRTSITNDDVNLHYAPGNFTANIAVYYDKGYLGAFGEVTSLWSSTGANNQNNSLVGYISNKNVAVSASRNRNIGIAIRCIAR